MQLKEKAEEQNISLSDATRLSVLELMLDKRRIYDRILEIIIQKKQYLFGKNIL